MNAVWETQDVRDTYRRIYSGRANKQYPGVAGYDVELSRSVPWIAIADSLRQLGVDGYPHVIRLRDQRRRHRGSHAPCSHHILRRKDGRSCPAATPTPSVYAVDVHQMHERSVCTDLGRVQRAGDTVDTLRRQLERTGSVRPQPGLTGHALGAHVGGTSAMNKFQCSRLAQLGTDIVSFYRVHTHLPYFVQHSAVRVRVQTA